MYTQKRHCDRDKIKVKQRNERRRKSWEKEKTRIICNNEMSLSKKTSFSKENKKIV